MLRDVKRIERHGQQELVEAEHSNSNGKQSSELLFIPQV